MDRENSTFIQEQSQKSVQGSRVLRVMVNLLMVVVLAALGFVIWQRFVQHTSTQVNQVELAPISTAAPTDTPASDGAHAGVPALTLAAGADLGEGILRRVDYRTIIPERDRVEVITYTVQRDDTLFGIADQFKLKPETILWGNFDTLQDNPHLLKPGQVLNILPTNGTYYKWKQYDDLGGVASFFGVDPQSILDYPGNDVDLSESNTPDHGLKVGQWVIVPGGKRALKDWGPPVITRKNASSAKYYGDGSCGASYEGAIGTGTFVYPTVAHSISGYNFSGVHPGIDFAGAIGNAVFASDNGVIVYAGWSNFGYGYLIVIDHGNGYQTAYGHLSAIYVGCGQSVFQGSSIGAVGSTGNSTGAHLHFELVDNGVKVNALDYLR
jgi:murein DD-endopeptidase MepM/ murein hydrolase activator NlpD